MMMMMMVMCQGRSMKGESCSQPLNSESPRYLCFCGCNTRPQNSFQIRTSGPTLEPACRRKTLLAFRGFRQVSFNFSKSKRHLEHQIAKCAFDVDVTWCCWIVAPTFCYGQSSFLLAGHLIQLARASVSMSWFSYSRMDQRPDVKLLQLNLHQQHLTTQAITQKKTLKLA